MNAMSTQTRKYESEGPRQEPGGEHPRRRIVEATVALHSEVGPAKTTIAEIARRAGVQRLTVYKHFPIDAELFAACSAQWMEDNPMPDLSGALAIEDPAHRVREVLALLYGRFRDTEQMIAHIQRDRLVMPALDERASLTFDAAMSRLAASLSEGFKARGKEAERLNAMLAVALSFWTWRALKRLGLSDAAAADVMASAVAGTSR